MGRGPPQHADSVPGSRSHFSREDLSSVLICTLSSNEYLVELLPCAHET